MEQALEYFGVITGLIYLFLEIKQHRAMWIVGFITSLVYVFVFFDAKVYADMALNSYYVAISVYGFWKWSREKLSSRKTITKESSETENTAIVYRHSTPLLSILIATSIAALWLLIWWILAKFTDSPIPVGDAFTTAVGIVATWMLAQRIIEHWPLWVVTNLVSVYLYSLRGLYPTMFLYICYAALAIAGWINWKKNGLDSKNI
jgi:nicotinamide mononucleotide transporter